MTRGKGRNRVKVGTTVLTEEKQVRAGLAGGMKPALTTLSRGMLANLRSMRTRDGGQAARVGEKYAKARRLKYGVDESVVYVASGELGGAVQNGRTRIRWGKYDPSQINRTMSRAMNRSRSAR